jgi:hypothetical protein
MYFDTKNNLKGNYKYIFFWKNRERKKKKKLGGCNLSFLPSRRLKIKEYSQFNQRMVKILCIHPMVKKWLELETR